MKNLLQKIYALFIILIISSCADTQVNDIIPKNNETPFDPTDIMSTKDINDKIFQTLESKGTFNWYKHANPHMIWSALNHGHNILSIGYGKEGESYSVGRNKRLELQKESIINLIERTENVGNNRNKQEIKMFEYETLNIIDVEVHNFETFLKLFNTEDIRYLEPIGYSFYGSESNNGRSGITSWLNAGCSDEENQNIASQHYTQLTASPNGSSDYAMASWHMFRDNINDAWDISTGSGITVGLIDTGVSEDNIIFNSAFNNGDSQGRTIEKYGTYVDSWWPWSSNYDGPNDKCGHGTSMASLIAAPRNNLGRPMGVAYNANLISIRGTANVLIDDYHEKQGVTMALNYLANRSDVKIISMSIGSLFDIGNVKDAIKYAHDKSKLIFAAGGTSTELTNDLDIVIFPARMSQAVAVTGIEDNANQNVYQTCNTCHKGDEIDFAVVMQYADGKHAVTNGYSGNFQNQGGHKDYTGGSSAATATMAGIAALIWETNPNLSKNQVLQILKEASAFYPGRHGDFGYGRVNVLEAVQAAAGMN